MGKIYISLEEIYTVYIRLIRIFTFFTHLGGIFVQTQTLGSEYSCVVEGLCLDQKPGSGFCQS